MNNNQIKMIRDLEIVPQVVVAFERSDEAILKDAENPEQLAKSVEDYREFLATAETDFNQYLIRINDEENSDLVFLNFCDAIENPAVRAAVRSLKSISHQVNNDIIRKWFVLLETSGQILSQLSITFASDCVLEHLGDLNVHELVFLSDFDCLLFRA
jgi:hypothetical protein